MFNLKILIFSNIILFSSCEQQGLTQQLNISAKPAPLVIKSKAKVAMAPDYDTSLVSQYIRSIYQDSKGNMWFGTINDGVVKYDGNTLTYFSDDDGLIAASVFAINEDAIGNIWLGTDKGLYKYDGKNFRNYNQQHGLLHNNISRKSIVVDKAGAIWVGTHSGVYRYDAEADKKGKPCFSKCTFLPNINVAGIMKDKAGNIWIASSDTGVFKYDGTTIMHFAQKQLMGENYAGGMAQDAAGNMWFTMQNGICKFDGKSFTEYTAKDGLGGTEFWGIYIEKSGIIWIT
ncbi:MAG: regulator, partial [Sediminibacterium sp.]|nr:regulator [Sediminibacterium sp.]